MKTSTFIWIIGVILALALGGAIYSIVHTEKIDNQVSTDRDTEAVDIEQYRNEKYGFDFAYPKNALIQTSALDDPTSFDTWSVVTPRAASSTDTTYDCGKIYPEDFRLTIGIVDLTATDVNHKVQAEGVLSRFDGAHHTEIDQGGKKLKIEKNIEGMCETSNEVLWKNDNGRYIVIFTYPSNTKREQDYMDVIQSFNFWK